MATNSASASRPVAASLSAPSLRQILLVHLIIFQEAVFGYHVHGFNFIQWIQKASQTSFDIGLFTRECKSKPRLPDTARLNSDREYRAWVVRDRCDTFCAVMQRFVNRHLMELLGLGGPTKWRRFVVIPQLRLISNTENFSKVVGHSILLITDGNGEKHIFDGTIDQYGRNWKTHWLMTKDELISSHMDLDQGFQGCLGGDEVAYYKEAEDPNKQHGYWVVAIRRMEHIFKEVDWISLHECTEDEIEAYIRSLSKTKFVGAYEEALAQ